MNRRDEVREAWGDAVYEAYRHGLDSDHVSYEAVADDIYSGATREEAVEHEVERLSHHCEPPEGEEAQHDPA